METIILELLPRHFINAPYISCGHCAIAKAAREKFNAKYVNEGVDRLIVGNNATDITIYLHNTYCKSDFNEDFKKAVIENFKGNQIIRTVKLYTK